MNYKNCEVNYSVKVFYYKSNLIKQAYSLK